MRVEGERRTLDRGLVRAAGGLRRVHVLNYLHASDSLTATPRRHEEGVHSPTQQQRQKQQNQLDFLKDNGRRDYTLNRTPAVPRMGSSSPLRPRWAKRENAGEGERRFRPFMDTDLQRNINLR